MAAKPHTDCTTCKVRCKGPMNVLEQDVLATFNREKTVRSYQPGQVIFYEGNRPFGMFCVESGKVKLSRYTADGKSYISRIAQAGDLLGYRAFLANEPYSATGEVIEVATLCFLERETFLTALRSSPAFSLQLLEQLGNDLKHAEDQACDLAYKSVPERLAELLISMRHKYGQDLPDGEILLDIQLSREEIASMIGATVETTVRTLSRFKELKLIGQSQKKMVLKDLKKLGEYLQA